MPTSATKQIAAMSLLAVLACTEDKPTMTTADYNAARDVALAFSKELASRDYDRAHGMTSRELGARMDADKLREQFEDMIPLDWGPIAPIEVGQTLDNWPGKQPSDLGWFYVSLGGDVYSEAVTVVVTREGDQLRVREVEFGRP